MRTRKRSKSVPRVRSLSEGLSELLGVYAPAKPEKPRYSFAYCSERNKKYYYDRKTRLTTWIKPNNFDEEWAAYEQALEQYDGCISVYSCAPPAPPPFSSSKKSRTPKQAQEEPVTVQGKSLASIAACSAASSWKDYLGGADDFLGDKKFANDAEFQAIPKPTWRVAYDKSTGKAYYYHRISRETTWYKPADFDKDQEEYKKRRNEYIKKKKEIEQNSIVVESKPSGNGLMIAAANAIRSLSPRSTRKETRSPQESKSRTTASPLRELPPEENFSSNNRPRSKFTNMFKRRPRKSNNNTPYVKSPAFPAVRKNMEPVHIYHEQDYFDDQAPIPLCTSPTYETGVTGTTGNTDRSSQWTKSQTEQGESYKTPDPLDVTPAQLDYVEWIRSPSANTGGGCETPAHRRDRGGKGGDKYMGGFEETIVSPGNANQDRYLVFEFPVEDNWEMKTMVSDISMFEHGNPFSMDAMCRSPCVPTPQQARGRTRGKLMTRNKRSKSTGRSSYFRF